MFCDGITLRGVIVLLAADTCMLAKDAIMQLSVKNKILTEKHAGG